MTVGQEIQVLDQFPVGMRVLAVDDDQTCLKILQNLLQYCQYHVTTTNQALRALELLRDNKNKFDLIISDVDMPDMDGFKLLELIGLEMDLPVIMLSAHSDPRYVMKGIKHGACDYLLKPVRIEEIKNIWQHVIRKIKFKKNKSIVSYVCENEGKTNRKRKDQFEEDEEEEKGNDNDDPTAQKKARVLWTRELHSKFLLAVDRLGVEKAVPKRILELMQVENLTRENIASHLQKFRLALKKLNYETSQQAKRVPFDSHLMQMSSLKGLGSSSNFHHNHQRPILVGSSQFHGGGGATMMRQYPSLAHLNSLSGGMFQPNSSSFPRNHNDVGGNILQGMILPSLDELHINNNNNTNKAFPSFTSQQSSLMVGPNNHLLAHEGQHQSSSPSLNPGFSPHLEMNKRLEHWSNSVLANNIPQSDDVQLKPEALEWNMFCNSASPLLNTGVGGSSNARQTELFNPLQMNQLPEGQLVRSSNPNEGLVMASDAGSLDDIFNSVLAQEQNQSDFSEGDLGFACFGSLGTCI